MKAVFFAIFHILVHFTPKTPFLTGKCAYFQLFSRIYSPEATDKELKIKYFEIILLALLPKFVHCAPLLSN